MVQAKINFVNNSEYGASLQKDILGAQDRIYVQTMGFEGDRVGKDVSHWLNQSKAKDKRLLIDSYSKVTISDRFIFNPFNFFNSAFYQELKDTKTILKELSANGLQVKYSNPLGWFGIYYPARNHKKIIIIDHICYIGGINFSEHNFSWYDLMLRIEIPEILHHLVADFLTTWADKNNNLKIAVDASTSLYFLDGKNSQNLYEELFQRLKQAKRSIKVYSPYITAPCLDVLKQISRSGVKVSIFIPGKNNKAIFNHYLQACLSGTNIKVFKLPGIMSHQKSIVVDDQTLVFGSANFDFVSYYLEQEVILVASSKDYVEVFNNQISMFKYEELISAKSTLRGMISVLIISAASLACWLHALVIKRIKKS